MFPNCPTTPSLGAAAHCSGLIVVACRPERQGQAGVLDSADEALEPAASAEGWIFAAGFASALALALAIGFASWEYRARSSTTVAPLSIENGASASSAQAGNANVVPASAPRRRGLGRLEAPVAGS